jgi:hypothetical protein
LDRLDLDFREPLEIEVPDVKSRECFRRRLLNAGMIDQA